MKKYRHLFFTCIFVLLMSLSVSAAAVARVGGRTYSSFQAAVKGAKAGETITLLKLVTAKKSVTVSKKVNLDFAGKKYTFKGNGYALKIKSSVTISRAQIKSTSGGLYVYKKAKVRLRSGSVTGANWNAGAIEILGGTYSGAGAYDDVNAPAFVNTGTLTIRKGTFKGSNRMLLWNYSKTTIYGGKFSAAKAGAIENSEKGKVIIKGGSFENVPKADDDALLSNYGKMKITKGTFKGFLHNETTGNGKLEINGGTFRGRDNWIVLHNMQGSCSITGGSFMNTRYNTVINEAGGMLTVTGGSFQNKSPELYFCIYNEGKLIASGGSFKTNYDSNYCIGCLSTAEWWVTGTAKGTVWVIQ